MKEICGKDTVKLHLWVFFYAVLHLWHRGVWWSSFNSFDKHLLSIFKKKKERNSRTIDTTITLLSQWMVLTVAQRAEERINWILNGLEDSIQNTVLRREGKRQKVTERRLIRKEEDEGDTAVFGELITENFQKLMKDIKLYIYSWLLNRNNGI